VAVEQRNEVTMRRPGDLDILRGFHGKGPNVFVETGTFHGKTARWAAERFQVVHTVELSPELYRAAAEALTPLGVRCHQGDTREHLPRLAKEIDEPVFWFLDAHWLDREHAAGKGTQLPLHDELTALAERPYADVIVVDDVASFGREDYQPGWGEVALEWIAGHFPHHKASMRYKDVAVVYR
jgi:predicted O-methyltransferase YrrM